MTTGNISTSARLKSIAEPLKRMMDDFGVKLRVAMPGIIQSFDSTKQTVTVQLAIREKLSLGGKPYEDVNIPIIEDVPIFMPRAGNFALTMPVAVGDECLVIFGDNCIDSWWESGSVGNQMDRRRHDLSDGFALLGIWSQPKVIANYSTDSAVLRSLDGSSEVEVKGSEINIITSTEINVQAATVNIESTTANIDATQINLTGSSEVVINGNNNSKIDNKLFLTHKHSGVQTGLGQTGGVV